MEEEVEKDGFQRRRDANFLLDSDRCLTAVGAPVVLARNYAGYGSLGRSRQGRWGVGEKEETPFKMASDFLKDRHDICVPVELLAGLIDEDSKLRHSSRSWDMPDTVCSDLSWPGSCLENLVAGHIDAAHDQPPLLVHATGPQNSHLALLPRPLRFGAAPPSSAAAASGRGNGTTPAAAAAPCGLDPEGAAAAAASAAVAADASAAIELENRLALHAGPIRQISALASRAGAPPRVFARCDYSATLVRACKAVDRLRHPAERSSRAVYERRIRRAKLAAGMPIAADDAAALAAATAATAEREEEGGDGDGDAFSGLDGFAEEEKLVFSRRLAGATCSPFTPTHAAFLDEEFRLFHWHADRGAVAHGSAPLPIPDTPPEAATTAAGGPRSAAEALRAKNAAEARRARNADVALDYGSHPRVLWIAGRHRAFRVDLRERPSAAALAPALDPGVYFTGFSAKNIHIVDGGRGKVGGRGEAPRVRSLAVGRGRSTHEVFVAAGFQLACMDVRFPRGVVARWDLPQEADQLRWLPGVPGEGVDAEEIILASARRSPGFYVNTWAKDVPGWRGCQVRLGLDDTSPAASAGRRPMTFSLPAPPLSEGETRSGGLLLALPHKRRGRGAAPAAAGKGTWFVHATSAGDVYGQRVEMRRVGDDRGGGDGGEHALNGNVFGKKAVLATPRSALLSDRVQSMLPCGDVCLDPDTRSTSCLPANPKAAMPSTAASAATVAGKNKPGTRHSVYKEGSSSSSSNDKGCSRKQGGDAGSNGSDDSERDSKSTDRHRRWSSRGGGSSDSPGGDSGRDSDVGAGPSASRRPRRSKGKALAGPTGPRKERRGRRDRRGPDNSESGSSGTDASRAGQDGRDSSSDSGSSDAQELPQRVRRKRPRHAEARQKAAKASTSMAASRAVASSRESGEGGVTTVEYFPVNAGALRAAVEKVPENALCVHRHLAPLVDLVSSGVRNGGAITGEGSGASSSAAVADGVSAAARQRERDFSDLRDRKNLVADFLLKPRTSEELLMFCRRRLRLEFPADPDPPQTPGAQLGGVDRRTGKAKTVEMSTAKSTAGSGNSGSSWAPGAAREGGSGSRSRSSSSSVARRGRPWIGDATIAVDVARAVLAWGKPFRNVETPWRAAAAGQSYTVVPPVATPPPRVATFVLCSAREVLKGEPSPFLRPGTIGAPLAVDVTVEDVRWLKDTWETNE
eukprot:g5093.t1